MIFKGIQKTSLIEYPGKIATVVFTGGCNFRCPICHNSELALNPNDLPDVEDQVIFDHLEKRKGLVEAVAITGGEPTLHPELPEFVKKVKDKGYLVEIETNGTNPNMVKELMVGELVDYWAMDIKAPLSNPEKYHQAIGRIGQIDDIMGRIKETVELILKSGKDYEFRTTYIPEMLEVEDFVQIGKDLKGSKKYILQGFRPVNNLNPEYNLKLNWPQENFDEVKIILDKYFDEVVVRNN